MSEVAENNVYTFRPTYSSSGAGEEFCTIHVHGGTPLEETADLHCLGETISDYLDTVSPTARRVFLRRYWYCDSLAEIALRYGFTQGKVKSTLFRTRQGLRDHLIREGYEV